MAWLALASRSKLAPMVKAARMVRKHLEGILNAVVLRTTNGAAESMNAMINQGDGLRVPQPRSLPQRDPVPSRRARLLPESRLTHTGF